MRQGDCRVHEGHSLHVYDHSVAVSASNPQACTPQHNCGKHPATHVHSYCDDHGHVTVVA